MTDKDEQASIRAREHAGPEDRHAPAEEHPLSRMSRLSSELAEAETTGRGRPVAEIKKDIEALRPDALGE